MSGLYRWGRVRAAGGGGGVGYWGQCYMCGTRYLQSDYECETSSSEGPKLCMLGHLIDLVEMALLMMSMSVHTSECVQTALQSPTIALYMPCLVPVSLSVLSAGSHRPCLECGHSRALQGGDGGGGSSRLTVSCTLPDWYRPKELGSGYEGFSR